MRYYPDFCKKNINMLMRILRAFLFIKNLKEKVKPGSVFRRIFQASSNLL